MVQISRKVDLIIAKITKKKKNMALHLAKTKINDSIKKRDSNKVSELFQIS
jgi:hypothetical protein